MATWMGSLLTLLLVLQGLEVVSYFWATDGRVSGYGRTKMLPWAMVLEVVRIVAIWAMYSKGHHSSGDVLALTVLNVLWFIMTLEVWDLMRQRYSKPRVERDTWSWVLLGLVQVGLVLLLSEYLH